MRKGIIKTDIDLTKRQLLRRDILERRKQPELIKSKTPTMLEKGHLLKQELSKNKTLLEAYEDKLRHEKQKENVFEEKLKALRRERREIIYENPEAYGLANLTKNQSRSEIIGAKEYKKDEAPDKLRVYHHYVRKYGLPYTEEGKKKTLEQIVRDIHHHEMTNRDEIIQRRILDPLTKTYGLYIV